MGHRLALQTDGDLILTEPIFEGNLVVSMLSQVYHTPPLKP